MLVFANPNAGTGLLAENFELRTKHFPNYSKKSLSDFISSIFGILSSNGKLESYTFFFAGSVRVSYAF